MVCCQYYFTLSTSFHARLGVPKAACIFSTLFNFFISTFPQSDTLFTNCYADDFTVSYSNSNVDQKAEALTAYASNIEEWADERGLAIQNGIVYCQLYFYVDLGYLSFSQER